MNGLVILTTQRIPVSCFLRDYSTRDYTKIYSRNLRRKFSLASRKSWVPYGSLRLSFVCKMYLTVPLTFCLILFFFSYDFHDPLWPQVNQPCGMWYDILYWMKNDHNEWIEWILSKICNGLFASGMMLLRRQSSRISFCIVQVHYISLDSYTRCVCK